MLITIPFTHKLNAACIIRCWCSTSLTYLYFPYTVGLNSYCYGRNNILPATSKRGPFDYLAVLKTIRCALFKFGYTYQFEANFYSARTEEKKVDFKTGFSIQYFVSVKKSCTICPKKILIKFRVHFMLNICV